MTLSRAHVDAAVRHYCTFCPLKIYVRLDVPHVSQLLASGQKLEQEKITLKAGVPRCSTGCVRYLCIHCTFGRETTRR